MRLRFTPRNRFAVFLVGVMATAVFAVVFLAQPFFLITLDNKVYDSFLRSLNHDHGTGHPLIVDIDVEAMTEYGQWPWPRYRLAMLLDRIEEAGALVVGIDFMFTEPDRTSLTLLAEQMRRELGVDLSYSGVDESELDNDAALAGTLSQGPYVLGYKFVFRDNHELHQRCPQNGPPIVWRQDQTMVDGQGLGFMHQAVGAELSIDVLSQAAPGKGFINATPDADGVVRRVPLVLACEGQVYPSFALSVLMQAQNVPWLAVSATPGGLDHVQAGELRIPVDAMGNILVDFHASEYIEQISAARVMKGEFEGGGLAGRIVLVGSTSPDLKDIYATPVDATFPAVKVHGLILDNILRGEFVSRPHWARDLVFWLMVLGGLGLSFMLAWFRALWSGLITLVATGGAWVGGIWIFTTDRVFVSPLWPSMAFIAVFLLCISLKYWVEERKNRYHTRELVHTQGATIEALAAVIETRDHETGEHIKRTQHYVRLLAERLRNHPRFKRLLKGGAIDLLTQAAPLHDIGKIGVPDRILQKPGKLTPEEFDEMKRHAEYGYNILLAAEEKLGSNPFLDTAKRVAYTHHERWDGTGYPRGLAGEDIPVEGRLMAIVDVYDALISVRVYKPPMTHARAMEIITQGLGSHFDPDVARAFIELNEVIADIENED